MMGSQLCLTFSLGTKVRGIVLKISTILTTSEVALLVEVLDLVTLVLTPRPAFLNQQLKTKAHSNDPRIINRKVLILPRIRNSTFDCGKWIGIWLTVLS